MKLILDIIINHHNENNNIPLFVKVIINDAYQEGWALYCENLDYIRQMKVIMENLL